MTNPSPASNMYPYVHPRDELVNVMSRMYGKHLTTSSGGNASIKDTDGTIWVTPKGNDKGALRRDEIAYLEPGETKWKGNYPPSSEWPFHTEIYKARSDVHAILHAHSQTLVAFSVANQLPNTLALSQASFLCKSVGLAPYAMPGTDALAENIVSQIRSHDCVIMANHGVVVVGRTMMEAYQKFEALEFCARAEVKAKVLGGQKLLLSEEDMRAQIKSQVPVEDQGMLDSMMIQVWGGKASPTRPSVTPKECDLRASLVKFIHRAYDQDLIHSTSGAMSARLSPTSFLITPSAVDRHMITASDIILVDYGALAKAKGCQEGHFYAEKPGRFPSRAWAIHCALYETYPEVNSVMHAHPFHITSFCMTSTPFTSNVIPESYIVLRDVGRIEFRKSLDRDIVAKAFGNQCDVLLVDNDGVIVKGGSMEKVFDRLEVLEATANVVLECKSIGDLHLMTSEQQEEIDKEWFGLLQDRPSKKQKKTDA